MSNIEKLIRKLPDDIDCAVITSDINRRYFSGMKSSAGTIIAFKEKAYLIIDFRYIEKARSVVKDIEVILQGKIFEQINSLIKKHNAKTLAVESRTMTLSELNKFQKNITDVEFDTSDTLSDLIQNIRAVKTEEEKQKIIKAQRIAEKSFENVLNHIKAGKTEKEIAFIIDSYMLQNGAEALSFETIALSGKNTSLPHGVPSEKIISDGDFVLMDYGAVYDGFHSDMTRTVCVGKPTDEMSEVYEIVLNAQKSALKNAKAGIKGSELDKIARDVISQSGYGENFGHSLGHGVGMEIHEFPNAAPSCDEILKENMIITIEPGIYIPDKFGIRIEDFGAVTSEGFENFTNISNKLISL